MAKKYLTVEEAEAKLEEIRENVDDGERAGLMEYALRSTVLRAISEGAPNAAALAAVALKTEELPVGRMFS